MAIETFTDKGARSTPTYTKDGAKRDRNAVSELVPRHQGERGDALRRDGNLEVANARVRYRISYVLKAGGTYWTTERDGATLRGKSEEVLLFSVCRGLDGRGGEKIDLVHKPT